jgi:hypothetical protein
MRKRAEFLIVLGVIGSCSGGDAPDNVLEPVEGEDAITGRDPPLGEAWIEVGECPQFSDIIFFTGAPMYSGFREELRADGRMVVDYYGPMVSISSNFFVRAPSPLTWYRDGDWMKPWRGSIKLTMMDLDVVVFEQTKEDSYLGTSESYGGRSLEAGIMGYPAIIESYQSSGQPMVEGVDYVNGCDHRWKLFVEYIDPENEACFARGEFSGLEMVHPLMDECPIVWLRPPPGHVPTPETPPAEYDTGG